MILKIDQTSNEPLYLQIRSQIIAAIAGEELTPGTTLPSVRNLARDLGVNLHTVNKAYAVLRDEGYIVMRGRSGAYIADPSKELMSGKAEVEEAKMNEDLYRLALAHRARGGSFDEFVHAAQMQARTAHERKEHE